MKIVRSLLSPVVLLLDRLTAPKRPKRSPEAQAELDYRTRNLTLFQLPACPFCVKVRRQIRRQGLNIALKDIGTDSEAGAELLAGGKLDQVPCLRIERDDKFVWLYESDAINTYLKTNF